MDAEKVKKVVDGLELCTSITPDGCLMLCPYKDEQDQTYSGFCEQVLKRDALSVIRELKAENERLKEQQPKRGKWKTVHCLSFLRDFKRCTCCGYICQGWDSETGVIYDYCPDCGAEMENGNTHLKCVENPIITVLKKRYEQDGEQE